MKHIIPQVAYWIIATAIFHQTYLWVLGSFTDSDVWSAVLLNYVGAVIVLTVVALLLVAGAMFMFFFVDYVSRKDYR